MPPLWFAAKRYGYGWYPCSKEGWLVLLAFLVLLLVPLPLLTSLGIDGDSSNALFVALYLPYVAALTAILFWICVKKGEKARWRGGG